MDVADKGLYTYPVFTDITKCDVQADVMIDFSSAKAVDGVLDFCREKKTASGALYHRFIFRAAGESGKNGTGNRSAALGKHVFGN